MKTLLFTAVCIFGTALYAQQAGAVSLSTGNTLAFSGSDSALVATDLLSANPRHPKGPKGPKGPANPNNPTNPGTGTPKDPVNPKTPTGPVKNACYDSKTGKPLDPAPTGCFDDTKNPKNPDDCAINGTNGIGDLQALCDAKNPSKSTTLNCPTIYVLLNGKVNSTISCDPIVLPTSTSALDQLLN